MYVLGIALMFGGWGASCGISFWQTSAKVERLQRMVMPGEHEVELAAGAHVLYAETRSTVGGTSYVWHGGALQCTAIESASNRPVPLTAARMTENYSFGGFDGQSMFELDIPTAGQYRVACQVASGAPMTVALSRGHVLGSMLYAMLGGFVVAAAGLTTILLTWDKRRKHRIV